MYHHFTPVQQDVHLGLRLIQSMSGAYNELGTCCPVCKNPSGTSTKKTWVLCICGFVTHTFAVVYMSGFAVLKLCKRVHLRKRIATVGWIRHERFTPSWLILYSFHWFFVLIPCTFVSGVYAKMYNYASTWSQRVSVIVCGMYNDCMD